MSHRGGKSHQIGRGAPHVSLGFQTSMRAEATKRRAAGDAAAPRAGMTTFKGENVWCKKCAGSKHGDAHSRLGDDGDDYANCTLYGSTAKLSKEKKRSLQLIGELRPASDAAAAQGEHAPKKARTEVPVLSCAKIAAASRSFVACGNQVIRALDELCVRVERDVAAEAHRILQTPVVLRPKDCVADGACHDDPALAKLLQRAKKLQVNLAGALRLERQRQIAGVEPYKAQMHFEIPPEPETEYVIVGAQKVEIVRKPNRAACLASGAKFFMIDLDSKKPFQPPGGLCCGLCGSNRLKVTQMSHTMQDRAGVLAIARADGTHDWLSGKGRFCQECKTAGRKATMFDYEGAMIAQMTANVQMQLPVNPELAWGNIHCGRDLELSLNMNTVNYQGGGTVQAVNEISGAHAHDEKGVAYDARGSAWLDDLQSTVGDAAWDAASPTWRAAFASRRLEYEEVQAAALRGEQLFEPWPSWEDVRVTLSDDVLRERRAMSHEARHDVQRRSVLSVGAKRRVSNDNTFHAAKKMGFNAFNITSTDSKEIATAMMLKSHGKLLEYKPSLVELFSRDNVSVEAIHTDDAPKNKIELELLAGAPLRGDKAHVQRRSTSKLNHYGAVHARVSHRVKLAFSKPRSNYVDLVDSLLKLGKLNVKLGDRQSKGRGHDVDKFSVEEIEEAKRVTFDEITGEKLGGAYWKKFASSKTGKMNIPMDTRAPSVIVEKMQIALKEAVQIEAERQKNPKLSKRELVTCLSPAFAHSIALLETSAEQLASVGDPWIAHSLDTRCVTGELMEHRSIDGSGYTEANNLCLDHLVVSNNVGVVYGTGVMLDGICCRNDKYRRQSGTESNFVHYDRGLAMIRNDLSLELHGAPVYKSLQVLKPDKPGAVIVCDFPESYSALAWTIHVRKVAAVRARTAEIRLAAKSALEPSPRFIALASSSPAAPGSPLVAAAPVALSPRLSAPEPPSVAVHEPPPPATLSPYFNAALKLPRPASLRAFD